MSVQSRASSNYDLFYAGLGMAVGAGVVLVGQAVWRGFAGYVDGAAATALVQPAQAALGNEAQAMGLPLVAATKAYWYMARAGGIVAYLLLWFATVWGIMMSSKLAKGLLVYGVHEFLPILAMVFATLHGIVLLGDQYIGFSVINLVVPFSAPYRPLWTGLGTLSLYLGIALIASFYVKNLVSRRAWRMFHYTAFLAFLLALGHGLMAGSDSNLDAVRWMYVLTGASVLFLTFFRILTARNAQRTAQRNATPAPGIDARTATVPASEALGRRQAAHAHKQEILARRQATEANRPDASAVL